MGSLGTIEIKPIELDVEMYFSHVDFADNAYKNIKERIEVPDVASRDRYNDMMKEFHDLITGKIVDPHLYTHDLAVQRTLIKAIGEKI